MNLWKLSVKQTYVDRYFTFKPLKLLNKSLIKLFLLFVYIEITINQLTTDSPNGNEGYYEVLAVYSLGFEVEHMLRFYFDREILR